MELSGFLTALLSNCVVIPAAALCIAPMCNQFRYSLKHLILKTAAVCTILIAGGSYLQCSLGLNPNTVLIPMLIIFFIAYHLSLKVHISQSAAVFSYVCAVMSVFANTANAFDALANPEGSAFVLTKENAMIQFCISMIGAALLFLPMKKYGSYLIDNLNIYRIWYITILFSGIVLYVNISMVPQKYQTLYTNNVFRIFWTLQIMFMAFEMLIAVIFYFIVKGLLDASKNEARTRFLEMQENVYLKQQRYFKETARARHDFKQIVRTIGVMTADNDIEGLKNYIKKYTDIMPENDTRHYCTNNAVNALLNHYAHSAVTNDINTNWEIDLPENTGINDTDLCITVGNILDNAVTACCGMTDGERYIKMTIKVRNGSYLYIIVVNSFNGNVRQKDDRYLSTSRKGSGIGLSSVSNIAEQNGGTAHFYHKENEFFSEVMMKVSKNE